MKLYNKLLMQDTGKEIQLTSKTDALEFKPERTVGDEDVFGKNGFKLHQLMVTSGINGWFRFRQACNRIGLGKTTFTDSRIPDDFRRQLDVLSDGSILRVIRSGDHALQTFLSENSGYFRGVARFFPRHGVTVFHQLPDILAVTTDVYAQEFPHVGNLVIQLEDSEATKAIVVEPSSSRWDFMTNDFSPGNLQVFEFRSGAALQPLDTADSFPPEVFRRLEFWQPWRSRNNDEMSRFISARWCQTIPLGNLWMTVQTENIPFESAKFRTILALHNFRPSPSRLKYQLDIPQSPEERIYLCTFGNGRWTIGDSQLPISKQSLQGFLSEGFDSEELLQLVSGILETRQLKDRIQLPIGRQTYEIPLHIDPVGLQTMIVKRIFPFVDIPAVRNDPMPLPSDQVSLPLLI